jgi:hypothetical protein
MDRRQLSKLLVFGILSFSQKARADDSTGPFRIRSYPELVQFIKDEHIRSPEQLLEAMKQKHRAYYDEQESFGLRDTLFDRVGVMIESASPETSSPTNPRLLLSNVGSSFTVAITTDLSQPDSHVLQVAVPKGKSGKAEFYEIEFSLDGKADPVFKDDETVPGHREKPQNCSACHANGMIWHTYPFWRGALPRGDEPTKKEAEQIANLRKSTNPRLQYFKGAFTSARLDSSHTSMGEDIQKQKLQQLADELMQHPEFEKLKYLLMGAIFSCKSLEDFVPPEIRAGRSSLPEVLKKTRSDIDAYYEKISHDGKLDSNVKSRRNNDHSTSSQNGRVRWVVDEFFGLHLTDYSMVKLRAPVFWDGVGGLNYLIRDLKDQIDPAMMVRANQLFESGDESFPYHVDLQTKLDQGPKSDGLLDPRLKSVKKAPDYADLSTKLGIFEESCAALQKASLKAFLRDGSSNEKRQSPALQPNTQHH